MHVVTGYTPQHSVVHSDRVYTETPQYSVLSDRVYTETPQHSVHSDRVYTETPQHSVHSDRVYTETPQHSVHNDRVYTETPQHSVHSDRVYRHLNTQCTDYRVTLVDRGPPLCGRCILRKCKYALHMYMHIV